MRPTRLLDWQCLFCVGYGEIPRQKWDFVDKASIHEICQGRYICNVTPERTDSNPIPWGP